MCFRRGLPQPIIGVGCAPQRHFGFIFFVVALIIFHQPRCIAQAENEDATRQRIQRAGVADAPLPAPAPGHLYDIMAGG